MRGPATCFFLRARGDSVALFGHAGIGKGDHVVRKRDLVWLCRNMYDLSALSRPGSEADSGERLR
jgi:hypothetical protein